MAQFTGEGSAIRTNPHWRELQAGDPVVSDYVLRQLPKGLAFVPFLFAPFAGAPERTKCPQGGTLRADLCFPYGELTDRFYTEERRHDATV